jgi:signal transduction histidine kinase/HAMP domain-containing protein
MKVGSIRWTLFGLIACCIAVPVAVMTAYFPATRMRAIESTLKVKAASFTRMVVDQTRSAIAFDDAETAREVFDGVTADTDVTAVALYRANGTLLQSVGVNSGPPQSWTDVPLLSRHGGRLRVVAPVISQEGPRGLLVLELSTARALSEGATSRRHGIYAGLLALLFGCTIAWFVGRSFAFRLGLLEGEAKRIASGDFRVRPSLDDSPDEIGELARNFATMVLSLNRAYAGIEQQVLDRTEALRESREQFRALLETTDAVPWEMELGSWRFTYLGPQAVSLFDVPMVDWLDGDRWTKLIQDEDRGGVMAAFHRAASQRTEQAIEFRFRRTDRRPLWIRCLFTAAARGAETMLRGFMFDVTERVEMEIELRQAQKLESIGRLASGVAHEINTPIQFISDSVHFVRDSFLSVSTLLDRYQSLKNMASENERATALTELERAAEDEDLPYLVENVPKALERSIDGLERVATIVRSMKEFAHPDQLRKTAANLNSALASTLVIARNEYKDVADVETSFGELPPVTCQLGELNQTFLNIIVNAAHAISENVVSRPRGLIRVTTRQEGDQAVIEISDTGGGIPVEVRERIFDPFFTTKAVGKGTGQGLAIARKSIVEGHGGSLTFATTVGEGSTFAIRIPIDGSP